MFTNTKWALTSTVAQRSMLTNVNNISGSTVNIPEPLSEFGSVLGYKIPV